MKLYLFILSVISATLFSQNFKTPYEKGNGNQTTTYEEMVKFYDDLDAKYQNIQVKTMGLTDSGEPLRLVLFSADGNFDKNTFSRKAVMMINNGIHPGEPDGIDASMIMLRNFAEGKLKAPQNVLLAVVESYNIGGMLNRGKYSRANQNGPEEYGFRGNARNYDLNRDFIKADSRNAQSFQEIFHYLNPDYFIDNHVSNGADYQYTFTYINTNKERLGKVLGHYQNEVVSPKIKESLLKKGIISVPYVEINGLKPEQGYETFMDTPRYATGYTTLFNTLGEVPETHMLKPYKDRVQVTYENMLSTIDYINSNWQKIKELKAKNLQQYQPGNQYALGWKIDSTKTKTIEFKGYEAGKKPSEISDKPRLFYDRMKPYTKKIPFYDTFTGTDEITIPKYYVIPKSEWKIIENLKRNNIEMSILKSDSTVTAEEYRIADFKTYTRPYEGHYAHYDTKVSANAKQIKFKKGDFLISLQQPGVKYLLETLEPSAVDSFFNWNFFDNILGQKEYYSDYVFEDTAAELLRKDKALKTAFEIEKTLNRKFAEDGKAQLDWVYKHSEYYEKSHMRYPICRIL